MQRDECCEQKGEGMLKYGLNTGRFVSVVMLKTYVKLNAADNGVITPEFCTIELN